MEDPTPTQEPNTDPAPPAAEPQTQNAPASDGGKPKGKPDEKQLEARTARERDEWKQKYADLEAKLKDGIKPEDLEAVRTEAKTEREALEAKHAEALLSAQIDVALVKAGCRDTAAARAHIDLAKLALKDGKVDGLDTTDLAKSYPYLFQATKLKDTGAAPAGSAGKVAGSIAEGVELHYKKG